MATILIVDDRRDFLELLKAQLESQGFIVHASCDALTVVSQAENLTVDAILMDLNMPEIDGCEAALMIKSNPATRHIPIIMCSAHGLQEDRLKAMESGCSDFLAKPIDLQLLVENLGTLILADTKCVATNPIVSTDSEKPENEVSPQIAVI